MGIEQLSEIQLISLLPNSMEKAYGPPDISRAPVVIAILSQPQQYPLEKVFCHSDSNLHF